MTPKISVIIATYNRSEYLNQALQSLLEQEIKADLSYEVLVVDNNSKDNTKEIVNSFLPKFKEKESTRSLRYLFQATQGKSYALNMAIKEAQGNILAFTDDDVVVDKRWLDKIDECFSIHDCDVVGGRILPLYSPETPQWIKDNSRLLEGPIVIYDFGEETLPYKKPMYEFFGANFSFKKEVFTQCGLFRIDLGPARGITGEDCEYISRLHKMNKTLYYCGQALVWHPVDPTRTNLQYIGRWNMQLGRYRFLVDDNGQVDKSLAYIYGIPRYLIGEILKSSIILPVKIFSRRQFLKEWIKLSNNWGKALETRKAYQALKAS